MTCQSPGFITPFRVYLIQDWPWTRAASGVDKSESFVLHWFTSEGE